MSENLNAKQNSNEDFEQNIDSVPIYRRKSAIIGALFIIIFISAGVYWFVHSLGTISTDDAYVDGNKLNISSKVLGRVVKLSVGESDSVHTGQLIAELDSVDLIARYNQSKAVINSSNESVALAKVNLEKAQIDFARAKAQFSLNVIPKTEYDNAQKKFEQMEVELRIAQSRVATGQADLRVITANLENTKMYSTINGVVAKRWILEGDVVQPGQPIFTIYDMKNLWVTAQLEETKINLIKAGDIVDIDVDSYPDIKFTGKVFQIGTNTAAQFSLIPPSNASGNFTKVTQRIPVKISIQRENSKQHPAFTLLPGMSVEVKIRVDKNE
jgi:membrane fusion protein, multidrug efflux system